MVHVAGPRMECARGHDLTVEENVYVYPDGQKRQCYVCMRGHPRWTPRDSSLCRNGHEKTADNALVTREGVRCRTCLRARQRARYHQRKAALEAAKGGGSSRPRGYHGGAGEATS